MQFFRLEGDDVQGGTYAELPDKRDKCASLLHTK